MKQTFSLHMKRSTAGSLSVSWSLTFINQPLDCFVIDRVVQRVTGWFQKVQSVQFWQRRRVCEKNKSSVVLFNWFLICFKKPSPTTLKLDFDLFIHVPFIAPSDSRWTGFQTKQQNQKHPLCSTFVKNWCLHYPWCNSTWWQVDKSLWGTFYFSSCFKTFLWSLRSSVWDSVASSGESADCDRRKRLILRGWKHDSHVQVIIFWLKQAFVLTDGWSWSRRWKQADKQMNCPFTARGAAAVRGRGYLHQPETWVKCTTWMLWLSLH